MSGGGGGGGGANGNGFRVSAFPVNVRKMIQTIKEMDTNHTDEEIYSMLKDCSMDPNDAAHNLLAQGTFHEVKRKRDRKKEILNNREAADSRWRSGPSGRVGRGGQGTFSSRYPADAGRGRHSISATENGVKESAGSTLPASAAKESKIKESSPVSSPTLSDNSQVQMPSGVNVDEHTSHISSVPSAKHAEVSSAQQSQSGVAGKSSVASRGGMTNEYGQPQPRSSKSSRPAVVTSSGHPSASGPVLVRSDESSPPGAIKHEIGSQQSRVEPSLHASVESKLNAAAHEIRSLSSHARMGSKPRGSGKNQLAEFSRPPSSGHGGSSSIRPPSNYGSRSTQVIGPPKGMSKEWKPKATSTSNVQVSMNSPASQQASPAAKPDDKDHPVHATISGSEEAVSKVEKELECVHIKETQHVIIPNHIHVPESVRTGLSFGSFDAAVVINSLVNDHPTFEKCAEHTSVSYHQAVEDSEVEQALSNDDVVAPREEGQSIIHSESSLPVPDNVSSSNSDAPSSSVADINNSKQTSGVPQQPVVYASPAYNLPVVSTPVLGNGALFDSSDSQARDAPRVPSFMVHQPVDPASANFYAQLYHSSDADGRISPFPSQMYNGNTAALPAEMSESSQEGGNPVTLSTIGQAPLATHAGVMPSNIAVSQQAVPVFRQPPGMPMPHYPPNFIPYGHYFSPFYVPSPAIPQFLGNNAFLQQGQTSTVYPGPPTGPAAPVKYSMSQFKPGSNYGNPAHVGLTGNYGPYGTSPAGYNAGSTATAGNSTNNEDLARSQYKENIMYTAGQQSEGSAVWIAAPGRDMSGLQANSFYNLPPQGQHMTFTPSQAGHSPFASLYHPAQAVTAGALHPLLQQSQGMPGAIDMAGAAPAGVYQQPQHATQMNWTNNY